MGLPVLNLKEEEQWRTVLQPLVVTVEVSEEDSVIEVEEVTVVEEVEEEAIEDAEEAEEEGERKRRNGSL